MKTAPQLFKKNEDFKTLPKTAQEAEKVGVSHFFTGRKCKNGHIDKRYVCNGKCAECSRQLSKKNRNKNLEKCKINIRKWQLENKKYISEFGKEYRKNLSLDKRCEIAFRNFVYQNCPCTTNIQKVIGCFTGKCFICFIPEIECNRKLSIDHCHKTGKFRGWLCDNCNTGLARFKDNPISLQKAINYLNNIGDN